ncbi:MAG TPA: FHA domain-containing protein [Thermoleophilaceae bacterium]|nr:FHA domain-containing protein [Thermoleophilaceae bacterium]
MDEPLAVALKFGFLAVLYLFLLWVSRSALRDLSRGIEPVASAQAAPAETSRRRDEAQGNGMLGAMEPRLEVIAALGYEPGTIFDLRDGATLGRSEHAEIRVDDAFASSAHARIFPRGDFMHVEDMGSTNGTYLNGRQLRGAERLKVADVIRIGDSEYRYQE